MNCLLNCINNNLLDYTEFAVAFQSLKLSLAQNKVNFFSKGRLKPFFAPLKYPSGVCLPQIFCAAAALCDNCASLKSAPIAQLEERQFPKLEATGSILLGAPNFIMRAAGGLHGLPVLHGCNMQKHAGRPLQGLRRTGR
jgi:hypothetical protein